MAERTGEVRHGDRPGSLASSSDEFGSGPSRFVRIDVVVPGLAGPPDLDRHVEQVTREQDGVVAFRKDDRAMPRRVPGGVNDPDARPYLSVVRPRSSISSPSSRSIGPRAL